jgi:hypothetical protein
MRCVAEGAEPNQTILCRGQQQYCCSSSTVPRRGWSSSSTCLRAFSSFDNYSHTLDTAGMSVHKVAGIRSSGPFAPLGSGQQRSEMLQAALQV